jgi:hypothetical protein
MTAVSSLKPLSIGQLLDRGIRLYRNNFLLFIGIVTITQIPATAFAMLLVLFTSSPAFFEAFSGQISAVIAGLVGFVIGIVSALITQIGTAALTRAIADIYLGQTIGILEAYRKIGNSWLTLISALLLSGLMMMGLFIFFFVPCIGWAAAIPGLGLAVFFAMAVIPLIAPIIVLEGRGARSAISRAWNLARQRFWWVFGFVIILAIFAQFIITGPVALTQVALLSVLDTTNQTLVVVIQQLVSFLLSIIYLPLQLTCITLLYFDIRVRLEGFDLALLAADAEESTDIDMTVVAADAPASAIPWGPTVTELGYFSLITVGSVVLFGAIFGVLAVLGLALGSAFGGL